MLPPSRPAPRQPAVRPTPLPRQPQASVACRAAILPSAESPISSIVVACQKGRWRAYPAEPGTCNFVLQQHSARLLPTTTGDDGGAKRRYLPKELLPTATRREKHHAFATSDGSGQKGKLRAPQPPTVTEFPAQPDIPHQPLPTGRFICREKGNALDPADGIAEETGFLFFLLLLLLVLLLFLLFGVSVFIMLLPRNDDHSRGEKQPRYDFTAERNRSPFVFFRGSIVTTTAVGTTAMTINCCTTTSTTTTPADAITTNDGTTMFLVS